MPIYPFTKKKKTRSTKEQKPELVFTAMSKNRSRLKTVQASKASEPN